MHAGASHVATIQRTRSSGQSRCAVIIVNVGTLIFDLDGTLSDPAVGIGRSLNYALEALGYRFITADDVFKFVGPPLDWAFRQIVPDASDETVRALVAKYRERYGDVGYAENVLYAGIAEAPAFGGRSPHGRVHIEADRLRRADSRHVRSSWTLQLRERR